MIIRDGKAIAGSLDRINIEPIEDYVERTLGVFSVSDWENMTEAQRGAYKLAIVYEDSNG